VRTLSARILLGFAALTVTFGVITGNIVTNQHTLEKWVGLLRQGYVPLALLGKNLERRSEDLKAYLSESFDKEQGVPVATVNLRNARLRRDRELAAMQKTLVELGKITDLDSKQFEYIRRSMERLQTGVDALKARYDAIDQALARGEPLTSDVINQNLAPLRDGERRLWNQTTDLAKFLEGRVGERLAKLEENEHRSRLITVYLGLTAVLLGLMVTIWVVITLRPLRRLRDAARRVAAGDYGSRIDERGPAEVKDLARELNSMARAVEERERELVRSERLAAVGKMAAMITHEVRNPLSSIGLNTELLEDEVENNDEARKLVRAIHHEVDRLTQITEEYLSFARLPKPKTAPEAVNTLVGDLAAFVRADLAAKQVKLDVNLASGDPIALVDAAQIRQCLINLVRNATEAVAGQGGGTVTLRTRRAADRVLIEVEDDGTGIAPDVLPRLFDPFFSTKDGGNGLGLALTQQIVKDHGGDLAVQSTLGRGTTFTVSVPAKPA
jgi:two-component system, NtrC family, sensor kinase